MAKQRKDVHKVQMTEGKRAIIQQLFQEYDIESAKDIQDALKDLLGGTIKEMMESEMDEHLGYSKSERSDSDNARNGYKSKTLNSSYGKLQIDVPQDRQSSFAPKVVKKRQKDISEIDNKIISMYAKGMTTRQISETINDIYGFEASEGFISDVTDKMLPRIDEWQYRPLANIYPVVFIDAIHFSVRQDNIVSKLAAYVVMGINEDGIKEVLDIEIGENESSKYWLTVLNSLKNRGVQDILILCSDGLTGLKEAVAAAFPKTEHQRCIVHMVRNTLKYVANKDMKDFAKDLRTIYTAPDEKTAVKRLEEVDKKWTPHYPSAMKRWHDNWDVITPIFKFSTNVRTAFYTTNAIESLNSSYRRLNRQRSVFPSSQALLKALYLATFEATKKCYKCIIIRTPFLIGRASFDIIFPPGYDHIPKRQFFSSFKNFNPLADGHFLNRLRWCQRCTKDHLSHQAPALGHIKMSFDLLINQRIIVLDIDSKPHAGQLCPNGKLKHAVGLGCPNGEIFRIGWVFALQFLDGICLLKEQNCTITRCKAVNLLLSGSKLVCRHNASQSFLRYAPDLLVMLPHGQDNPGRLHVEG